MRGILTYLHFEVYMSPITRKKRATKILSQLSSLYPNVKTALENWENDIQFLLAVSFSAQTTDVQVNKVTKILFKKYKTATDFAQADPLEFENEINSLGFFRGKARRAIECAKMIVRDYKGKVPTTLSDLIMLPGVGRKTANVFLNVFVGDHQGIAVDTHVRRLSTRLRLTRHQDPEKIEQDLIKLFAKKDWDKVTLLLIAHGRAICKARTPQCGDCILNKVCPSAFNV